MKIRRQITGVLCGLLDTFGSRYSDYDGYWVFGLLAREADVVSFDLLREEPASRVSPVALHASQLARLKFLEQIERAHIPLGYVSKAQLVIQKIGDSKAGPVNGRMTKGHQMSLAAEATSDLGKKYFAERFLFVAPHDPSLEHRSVRRTAPIQSLEPTAPSGRG